MAENHIVRERIVDTLEEMGIVSGSKGTTGREILMTKEQVDRLFKMGEQT